MTLITKAFFCHDLLYIVLVQYSVQKNSTKFFYNENFYFIYKNLTGLYMLLQLNSSHLYQMPLPCLSSGGLFSKFSLFKCLLMILERILLLHIILYNYYITFGFLFWFFSKQLRHLDFPVTWRFYFCCCFLLYYVTTMTTNSNAAFDNVPLP